MNEHQSHEDGNAPTLEEVAARYEDYVDTAFRVAVLLAGYAKATALLECALTAAIQAELLGRHVVWPKAHLLSHLRRTYRNSAQSTAKDNTAPNALRFERQQCQCADQDHKLATSRAR